MALPVPPVRPLTVAEYAALPEGDVRYELQEGNLVMSPRPVPEHQLCLQELQFQLRDQVPDGLRVVAEVDVDLGLAEPSAPGSVRSPDLVVVTESGLRRRRRDGGFLLASEVLLAVEVTSPGSYRTDHVIKQAEYADAGVPHYWVVDREGSVTLTAHHLAGAFGYVADAPAAGVFVADEPFPVRLELDRLA